MWAVWQCHVDVCAYMLQQEEDWMEFEQKKLTASQTPTAAEPGLQDLPKHHGFGLAHVNSHGCTAWHWLAMATGFDEPEAMGPELNDAAEVKECASHSTHESCHAGDKKDTSPPSPQHQCTTLQSQAQAQAQPQSVVVARWLLKQPAAASPCALNNAGHSGLHKAAARGRMWFVQWLLRHTAMGASEDTLRPDEDNRRPSDYAALCGHTALSALLRDVETRALSNTQ
jgi:hypothetical protein